MIGHDTICCTAARMGLPMLLFLLHALLGLCHMPVLLNFTHAAGVGAEKGDLPHYASSLTSTTSSQAASVPPHPWEATCAAYRTVTVSFPLLHANATYDLRSIVEEAPHKGWTCKAYEPLFEFEEYSPFFRSMFAILLGNEHDDKKEQGKVNELHKHKDKHVFFAFNPCRLLPHSCHGSRGRLFKFAAKLKTPHDPDEEIDRLLANFLKLPAPHVVDGTDGDSEEVADTTECLQNVLPTNTTLLYSHLHASAQQHPSSNGLGGLWSEPDISDDPTPWEALDPKDPHKGLQSNMRHSHIFCPDSSLHTHIVLKCPSATSGSSDSTKFESCEHLNPCLFRMVLTAKAACPSAVYESAKAAASMPRDTATVPGVSSSVAKGKELTVDEKLPLQQRDIAQSVAQLASAASHAPQPSSQQHVGGSEAHTKERGGVSESRTGHSSWPFLWVVLVFGMRMAVCGLIFAWMIYTVRDWTQSKMQYTPLPEERAAEPVANATCLNSYDSCVKALAETSRLPDTSDARTCELASTYTHPRTEIQAECKPLAGQAPPRVLRGLFSSPGRRFVSVWLPHTLDVAAQQAHTLAAAAQGACASVLLAITRTDRQHSAFTAGHSGNDGTQWDWTNAVGFQESDEPEPDSPPDTEVLGRCGYETI